MPYTDREILSEIRAGNDSQVLQHLYETVLPKVKGLVLSKNGNAEDAYDVFQESVMKFYAKAKKGTFKEAGNIGGFIYTSCKNLWLNKIRDEKKISNLNEDYDVRDEQNHETELISEERVFLIRQLLNQLGESCKAILNYKMFHGFSMREIAKKLGLASEDVAKTRHYKCKKRLVEMVKTSKHTQEMLRDD